MNKKLLLLAMALTAMATAQADSPNSTLLTDTSRVYDIDEVVVVNLAQGEFSTPFSAAQLVIVLRAADRKAGNARHQRAFRLRAVVRHATIWLTIHQLHVHQRHRKPRKLTWLPWAFTSTTYLFLTRAHSTSTLTTSTV